MKTFRQALLILALPSSILLAPSNPEAFFSIEVTEKANVLDHYPLTVGNKWVYQNKYKSAIGNTGKIITITWTSEISTRQHHDTSHGKIILRGLTIRDLRYDYPPQVQDQAVSWFKDNIPSRRPNHYLTYTEVLIGSKRRSSCALSVIGKSE